MARSPSAPLYSTGWTDPYASPGYTGGQFEWGPGGGTEPSDQGSSYWDLLPVIAALASAGLGTASNIQAGNEREKLYGDLYKQTMGPVDPFTFMDPRVDELYKTEMAKQMSMAGVPGDSSPYRDAMAKAASWQQYPWAVEQALKNRAGMGYSGQVLGTLGKQPSANPYGQIAGVFTNQALNQILRGFGRVKPQGQTPGTSQAYPVGYSDTNPMMGEPYFNQTGTPGPVPSEWDAWFGSGTGGMFPETGSSMDGLSGSADLGDYLNMGTELGWGF